MKDALMFIITLLVDHPESVTIDQSLENTTSVFTVHVHPEDMGKIIGKSGRIIRAIREIARTYAAKLNTYIDIKIAEDTLA